MYVLVCLPAWLSHLTDTHELLDGDRLHHILQSNAYFTMRQRQVKLPVCIQRGDCIRLITVAVLDEEGHGHRILSLTSTDVGRQKEDKVRVSHSLKMKIQIGRLTQPRVNCGQDLCE